MYVILVKYPGDHAWEQIGTRATEQEAEEVAQQYEADHPSLRTHVDEA